MSTTNNFSNKPYFNAPLHPNIETLKQLGIYLDFVFKTRDECASKAGISRDRLRQILIGYNLPQSPKIIYKLANGWGIDPVKLTLLFEKTRNTPQIVTADELEEELKPLKDTAEALQKKGESDGDKTI